VGGFTLHSCCMSQWRGRLKVSVIVDKGNCAYFSFPSLLSMTPALRLPTVSQETMYSLTGLVSSDTVEGTKPITADLSPGVTFVMTGAVTGGIS